jgi:hypothetical protein
MIFSVHIPKTAGTSFRRALEERFGPRLALYYGVRDPKTTEGLRVPREEVAGAAARLAEQGFEVLHGHYPLRLVAPLITDASAQVWTWLRDPVDRTISQFDFYKERPLELKALAGRVKAGEFDLDDFAKIKGVRDLQTRYLKGFALSDLAFVGVVEQFELGLALLFGDQAPELKRRYNATDERSKADADQRTRIAELNARDMQLYVEGLRLFVDRLAAAADVSAPERPTAAGSTLVKRLMRRVA